MTNTATPSGFTPRSLQTWHRYYIPKSDTSAYGVGDLVRTPGGADANGIPTVALHTGSATVAVRGAIVAVDPGLPATGGYVNGTRLRVPATKTQDYYVWVCDDPEMEFLAVDDGLTPSALVGANMGSLVGITLGAAPNAAGGSATALTSSSFGGTTGLCKVVGLAGGSVLGPSATWVVRFPLHELGNAPTASSGGGGGGGGSGGATTVESASRALVSGDNGNTGITANPISLTVNAGMGQGFNYYTQGTGQVTWVAGSGVQIQDQRQAGATYFTSFLQWVGPDSYVVTGAKA